MTERRPTDATLKSRFEDARKTEADRIEAAASSFVRSFSLSDLKYVFEKAANLEVVSPRGIHLDLPGDNHKVRFSWRAGADEPTVLVELTSYRFESVTKPLEWKEHDDPLVIADFLAGVLERLGPLPAEFDPDNLLRNLCRILCDLISLRTKEGLDLSPVVYLPNKNWAVTEYGVECVCTYYPVQESRLGEQDWVFLISKKTWADYDEVHSVFAAAGQYFHVSPYAHATPAMAAAKTQVGGGSELDGNRVPRIFIASSTEALAVANALQEGLDRYSQPTVWTQDIFSPTEFVLESLLRAADEHDYGVFVFSQDDMARMRGVDVPVARDNIVFELGLFMGRRGRKHCFLVKPRDVIMHLPSDLVGIGPLDYNDKRDDKNLTAALGPAANQILRTIGCCPPSVPRT